MLCKAGDCNTAACYNSTRVGKLVDLQQGQNVVLERDSCRSARINAGAAVATG